MSIITQRCHLPRFGVQMCIIYGIRMCFVQCLEAALGCLGSSFASGSSLAALGCSWARFVISRCNLVVFGAQFYIILSNKTLQFQCTALQHLGGKFTSNLQHWSPSLHHWGAALRHKFVIKSIFMILGLTLPCLGGVCAAFLVFAMPLSARAIRGCSFPTFPHRRPGFVRAGAGTWWD